MTTAENYDKIIAGKKEYLKYTFFFLIRSFIYVIIWVFVLEN